MDEKQKHDAMFLQLVITFQSAAWIQLGKVKNPQTDKVERDLNQAQYSIDMLDMLKAKTSGNLSDEEAKMLNSVLTTLKMNYLEEIEKDKKEKKAAPQTEEKQGTGKEEKKGEENKEKSEEKKETKDETGENQSK